MSASTAAATRPRGALGLMFDRVFGTLFWGKVLSVVGVWTHGIVAAIVMYDATGSALMVGLVGVVQFAPQLILSPITGKWADLGNPGRQILLGRVFCVAGSASIAVWFAITRTWRAAVPRRDPARDAAGGHRLRDRRPGHAVDCAQPDPPG